MLVLDEQLLGLGIEVRIQGWYAGSVQFISDLRPGTVIEDAAIPGLLRQQRQPTFVTINERDFWRKVAIDRTFCIVCFAWHDSRARDIPQVLRQLFHRDEFHTKAKRMGCVVRVTDQEINYYTVENNQVQTLTK